MSLKNNGRLTKKIIGLFGEVTYTRSSLIPTNNESAARLLDSEGLKSIFPLDNVFGVANLPFKISSQMMCAIAKEAVRAQTYQEAKSSIEKKYKIKMSSVQVEKVTDYVGSIVFANQQREAEQKKTV